MNHSDMAMATGVRRNMRPRWIAAAAALSLAAASAVARYVWLEGPGMDEATDTALAVRTRLTPGTPMADAEPLLVPGAVRRRVCREPNGGVHLYYYGSRIVEKSAAVRVLTRGHDGDERVQSADVLNEALISYHRDCPEVPLPNSA